MDEKDFNIIEILLENARTSKVRIAEALGVTETAVRKRIQKLENSKVIIGYRAVINYKVANLLCSLTGVDVEPERLWRVAEEVKNWKEVKAMWLTTGDHTLMLEIVVRDVEELSNVHKRIEKIEGVRRVCPSIVLDVLK